MPVHSISGKTEDWLPFWRLFKQGIHDHPDLDDGAKLAYLIQAMKEPGMKANYSERMEDDEAYSTILAELHAEYDKPRWMHRKYCESMRNLATNPHTREGIKDLTNQVTTILKGFIRLKAENCRHILTSMTEAVMSKELRTLWNQRTDKMKETPPIEDLLLFMKEQADQLDEEAAPAKPVSERSRNKPAHSKQRGSTHVATAPPVSTPAVAPAPAPVSTPPPKARGVPQAVRTTYPPCRYSCPLCPENHYPYFCKTFEAYSAAQRKEHVRAHSLCTNCLKPGHTPATCRSTYKCKTCEGEHNTLLHEEQTAASHPSIAATNTANAVTAPHIKDSLMMTSQALITGPTGVTMVARSLLDSGSTLSILSSKAMKTLALRHLGSSVCIDRVGASAANKSCPLVNITLSSSYKKDRKKEVTVAVMSRVTRDLPLQGASSVRSLPHLQDLHLADEQFDKPGTIDLLLGQDVWQELFLPGEATGPPGTPAAWHTVFGWVVMGHYTPDNPTRSITATAQAVSSTEAK